MKTVIEELENDIIKLSESKCYINPNNVIKDVLYLLEHYKEKEKYHLIRAHDKGIQRFCYHDSDNADIPKGEEYYNEVYNEFNLTT